MLISRAPEPKGFQGLRLRLASNGGLEGKGLDGMREPLDRQAKSRRREGAPPSTCSTNPPAQVSH